uniref:Uncharacterized protein n=1 Tax=Solanum lycopersicum TaxID=4081 RepID=A0A3Q7FBK9_SOLLC
MEHILLGHCWSSLAGLPPASLPCTTSPLHFCSCRLLKMYTLYSTVKAMSDQNPKSILLQPTYLLDILSEENQQLVVFLKLHSYYTLRKSKETVVFKNILALKVENCVNWLTQHVLSGLNIIWMICTFMEKSSAFSNNEWKERKPHWTSCLKIQIKLLQVMGFDFLDCLQKPKLYKAIKIVEFSRLIFLKTKLFKFFAAQSGGYFTGFKLWSIQKDVHFDYIEKQNSEGSLAIRVTRE